MINKKISPMQLGCMMFMATVYFASVMTGDLLSDNFTDSITSVVLSFLMGVVLSVPLLISEHKTPDKPSAGDKYLVPLYVVYFFFSGVMELSYMISMLNNTILPEDSPWVLAAGLIFPAAYSVYKGVETMGRGSLVLTAFYVISFILVIIGAMDMVNFGNLKFPFNDGGWEMLKNSFIILTRSTVIPQLVIISQFLNKGRRDKVVFYIWYALSALIMIVSLFMIIICLGEFADVQQFPMFTLSTAAALDPLQRLDIVFTSAAAASLTVKLALSIFGIVTLLRRILKKSPENILLLLTSVPMMIFSVLVSENNKLQIGVYTLPICFLLIIFLGFFVPLVKNISIRIKEK